MLRGSKVIWRHTFVNQTAGLADAPLEMEMKFGLAAGRGMGLWGLAGARALARQLGGIRSPLAAYCCLCL